MLTDDCKNRLYNWKFNSAYRLLTDEATPDERRTVGALDRLFGNSGWLFGDIGELVRGAVRSLGVEDD